MFSRTPKSAATARPKAARASGAGLSVIGTEVVISGDLASSGQLHVEGRIEGHVRCGQLCQAESGVIAGDIQADEARIGGLVEGKVNAKTVVIEASGRVTGDVAYDVISIAAGAQIEGRLARRDVLASDADAPLVATLEPEQAVEPAMLFSATPTRIAAD